MHVRNKAGVGRDERLVGDHQPMAYSKVGTTTGDPSKKKSQRSRGPRGPLVQEGHTPGGVGMGTGGEGRGVGGTGGMPGGVGTGMMGGGRNGVGGGGAVMPAMKPVGRRRQVSTKQGECKLLESYSTGLVRRHAGS